MTLGLVFDTAVSSAARDDARWSGRPGRRTYVVLTDVEAVFRSLISVLGLRPIYHRKEARTDGQLFITVLAYLLAQFIRSQLKDKDIHDRWTGLREIFSVQRRVTAAFTRRNGRTLNVRKTTQAEPDLQRLYEALGIDASPGGMRKFVIAAPAPSDLPAATRL